MERKNIKRTLENMKTKENESAINHLLKSLDEISDEELKTKLNQLNISEENIEQYLSDLIRKSLIQEDLSDKFININELFCYGRTKNTIHMHIIPKDLRGFKKEIGDKLFYYYYKEQLEDFLSRMQIIFSEDTTINSLFAVSPIFFNPNISSIHESLGFDKLTEIDLNNKKDKMSIEQKLLFLNMFNKNGKNRKVYYTNITREKLLGMKYSQITEKKSHSKFR
ncbi:MAG: hypothetical protein VZS44_05305 [Bacilli bacterium]|nr:hypothetical protein [Bacilli bacterium]